MLYVKTKLDKSDIHGIGCFADEDISKGTIVWKFVPSFDQEFPRDFIQKLSTPTRQQVLKYAYVSKSTGNYILCSDDTRFFNHSDDNNIQNIALEGEQEGIDIANRDIKAGEELTYNYNVFGG
jgi:SET domain-containing protein